LGDVHIFLVNQLDDEYAPVKMTSILCLERRRDKSQESKNQLIVNIDKNVNGYVYTTRPDLCRYLYLKLM